MRGAGPRFVSRGGEKLDAALAAFPIVVAGRRAVDVGTSTGGFTDCLLQHGASHVHAIDVGRGQLAWSLRTHPRVTVLERTNARSLDASTFGGPVPLAVADLTFISPANGHAGAGSGSPSPARTSCCSPRARSRRDVDRAPPGGVRCLTPSSMRPC